MDGLFVGRNFDAFDFFQFLDAALHLFGLGGLGTEAVDEGFELLDAVALIFVSGFELRPAFGFLLFVLRIAAGVELDPLVPDLGDLETVRRGNSDRARSGRRHSDSWRDMLEPVAGFDIEMVGRLVEQQKIGLFEQQFGERDAHLPAAGKFFDAALPVVAPETEAGENGADAGFDVVSISRGEFVLRLMVAFGDLADIRSFDDRVRPCGARVLVVPVRGRGVGEYRHAFGEDGAAGEVDAVLREVASANAFGGS